MEPRDTNAPFFVVGSDRSGTTMLRLMLNQHPRLCVPRESWFVRDLMDHLPLDETLTPAQAAAAFEIVRSQPHWPDWEVSDGALRAALAVVRNPRLSGLVDAIFQGCGNPEGKPRWGDKTPPYCWEIPRLHRVFPEARFVHVIRDARDVGVSLLNVGWHGQTAREVADYWTRAVGAGIQAGRSLGPALYCEVAYEDLVQNTRPTLERICAFLGETVEPAMLEFNRHAAQQIAPSEHGFHQKTLRPPAPSDVQRWKSELTPVQVAAIEAIAGRTMTRVGQQRRFGGLWLPVLALLRVLFWTLDVTRAGRHRLGLGRIKPAAGAGVPALLLSLELTHGGLGGPLGF